MNLDFRIHLPKIADAFEYKELQCFQDQDQDTLGTCLYAGPCAIGCVLPEEMRKPLDDLGDNSIGRMFRDQHLNCPEKQRQDWIELQNRHDLAVGMKDKPNFDNLIARIGDFIEELKIKYLLHLDFRVHLPKIIEAYQSKELQMFKEKQNRCLYTGPCAVGACMEEEIRPLYDSLELSNISSLINYGYVVIADGQQNDWRELQALHDLAACRAGSNCFEKFGTFIEKLRGKYL